MSTPTTPLGSKSGSPSSTPQKRKLASIERVIEVITAIDDNEENVATYKEALQRLKAILNESGQLTPTKKARLGVKVIQASSLKDISFVVNLFGLEYHDDERYIWEQPEGGDVRLSNDAMTLLGRMRRATFWKRESAEALSRTLIDIVLFDRLEAHQEELAARSLSIRGEVSIEAQVSQQKGVIITGNADYVLGYDPIIPSTPKTFESTSIILEAKRRVSTQGEPGAVAQAVAYMIGAQQKRMSLETPKRIVDTIYGIVSDGITWQFLRLNAKRLQVSVSFNSLVSDGRCSIYRFVDAIITASISLSPHTTPQRRFPATTERWLNEIEPPIFGKPI